MKEKDGDETLPESKETPTLPYLRYASRSSGFNSDSFGMLHDPPLTNKREENWTRSSRHLRVFRTGAKNCHAMFKKNEIASPHGGSRSMLEFPSLRDACILGFNKKTEGGRGEPEGMLGMFRDHKD